MNHQRAQLFGPNTAFAADSACPLGTPETTTRTTTTATTTETSG